MCMAGRGDVFLLGSDELIFDFKLSEIEKRLVLNRDE